MLQLLPHAGGIGFARLQAFGLRLAQAFLRRPVAARVPLRGSTCLTQGSGFVSISDVPEPEEGSEEQLDPVPLKERRAIANVLEKVKLEFL